jgi:AcrR family transcriptional regulator
MPRKYTLKKRAEAKAETRRRIVEAAVELHSSVGPAATTLSMIAERAGVQRHTLYAHFPDERSLLTACSGLSLERDPFPPSAAWADIVDVRERLERGLSALYGWYARNADLMACVLRDAELLAPTREITELRFGPPMAEYRQALGAGLAPNQQTLLALAIEFHTWRTLAREAQLSPAQAAELISGAIVSANGGEPAPRRSNRRDRAELGRSISR